MCFKIFLFVVSFLGTDPKLEQARSLLAKGAEDKEFAYQLKQVAVNMQDVPVMKAYYAMSFALMAKHSWNPIRKFEYVKVSLKLLNESVEADTNDIESRFLRFCLEDNIPSFFPFKSHIEEDKAFILSKLNKSHSFYPNMLSYMKQAYHISKTEKSVLPKN